MRECRWRIDLERAMGVDRAQKRIPLVQLATVRSDFRPANRTLVFRGFWEGSNALVFTTDCRSAKVEELGREPRWAEACWYLTEAREQYRFGGRVEVIGEDASGVPRERRAFAWSQLSTETRASFGWPAPGSRCDAGEERGEAVVAAQEEPPGCFGLLVLEPWHVDHLELTVVPHRRRIYERDEQGWWSVEDVHA